MAYLNANIPVQYAQIRREYLYDLKKHHGEVEDCIIFGLSAITGRAILFHCIMENGAIFYRLPISAFIQKGFKPAEVPRRRLDELQLWNCFSYYPAVTSWDILEGQSGKYIGKDKKWHPGAYLLARLFNKDIDQKTFPSDALMNWSFGILSLIILLLLLGIF